MIFCSIWLYFLRIIRVKKCFRQVSCSVLVACFRCCSFVRIARSADGALLGSGDVLIILPLLGNCSYAS